MRISPVALTLGSFVLISYCNGLAVPRQQTPTAQESHPDPVQSEESEHEKAKEELHEEEHQRILGVVPNFNTINDPNAPPLTAGEKFQLALHSGLDPFQLVLAGLDAGISQWRHDFPGYGLGAQGYGKRVGAAYADQLSSVFWGNALFPSLLHQDPRYFRKGSGTTSNRFFYAVSTALRTKNDKKVWAFNYSNVLGNFAAGGLANIYYPRGDRGASLTLQRALTVTAEGSIGAVFLEFWPDISKKVLHHEKKP
jgi:hypothetical protein